MILVVRSSVGTFYKEPVFNHSWQLWPSWRVTRLRVEIVNSSKFVTESNLREVCNNRSLEELKSSRACPGQTINSPLLFTACVTHSVTPYYRYHRAQTWTVPPMLITSCHEDLGLLSEALMRPLIKTRVQNQWWPQMAASEQNYAGLLTAPKSFRGDHPHHDIQSMGQSLYWLPPLLKRGIIEITIIP